MDIKTLHETITEPHVLIRPIIDVEGGEPIEYLNFNGRRLGVGEHFRPSLYWLAKRQKLTQEVWEYVVENSFGEKRTTLFPQPGDKPLHMPKKLDPYIVPVSVLSARAEKSHVDALEKAFKADDANGMRKALGELGLAAPAGALVAGAASIVLQQKGRLSPAPTAEPAPAPVEPTAPMAEPEPQPSKAALIARLRDEVNAASYNGIGKALKAMGIKMPQAKEERLIFAQDLLAQLDAAAGEEE